MEIFKRQSPFVDSGGNHDYRWIDKQLIGEYMPNIYRPNIIKESTTAFGAVGAGYATIITLNGQFNGMVIENSLNQACTLKIGDNEITLSASTNYTFDKFKHNGAIQLKHNGVAPASGNLITKHWV